MYEYTGAPKSDDHTQSGGCGIRTTAQGTVTYQCKEILVLLKSLMAPCVYLLWKFTTDAARYKKVNPKFTSFFTLTSIGYIYVS